MGETEKGALCQLVIQEEPSYKTPPETPDAQVLNLSSESISFTRPNESSDIMRGSNRNPTKPGRGLDDVSGDIQTELQAYIGILFKGLLGTVSSVVDNGIGTHIFKVGTSLPSFLVERKYPTLGKYARYTGVKIGKFSMDITSKGFQKVTFGVVGATETIVDAPFDATPMDLGKTSFDGRSIMTIEEGGAAIATVTKISGLTFENNLDTGEDNYVLGGDGSRVALPEGTVKVTGTLTALFQDLVLYNKAKNGTESSLRVKWGLGDGSGSAGNESLELKLPELVYSPKSPAISGPKGLMTELSFEGYYDNSSEGTALQLILKNTQTAI